MAIHSKWNEQKPQPMILDFKCPRLREAFMTLFDIFMFSRLTISMQIIDIQFDTLGSTNEIANAFSAFKLNLRLNFDFTNEIWKYFGKTAFLKIWTYLRKIAISEILAALHI